MNTAASSAIPVSVVVIAHNEGHHIARALRSVAAFDEVLVYENGSTDDTAEVARQFPNVTLVQGEFLGFGRTRNHAASFARHDWILTLDCDEWLTAGLVEEIRGLPLNDPTTLYELTRVMWFQGARIRFGDWGPEQIQRLYHRAHCRYAEVPVHEYIEGHRHTRLLAGILEHEGYEGLEDFLAKMNRYTSLHAQARPRNRSMLMIALRVKWTFLRSYVFKLGFLDGWRGFMVAWTSADSVFYKHLKARLKATATPAHKHP